MSREKKDLNVDILVKALEDEKNESIMNLTTKKRNEFAND